MIVQMTRRHGTLQAGIFEFTRSRELVVCFEERDRKDDLDEMGQMGRGTGLESQPDSVVIVRSEGVDRDPQTVEDRLFEGRRVENDKGQRPDQLLCVDIGTHIPNDVAMTKRVVFVGYPTPEARLRGVRDVSPPCLVIRIVAKILITIVE
jgi:hypothetical protein